MRRNGFILSLSFFLVLPSIASAQDDPMKGPWKSPVVERPLERQETGLPAVLLGFYRDWISPIDGSECPMVPSCSQYSAASFEKRGFFMGWIMTWDRLYRCGRDELDACPLVFVDGRKRCYDPVESNDFWWTHEK